MTIRDTIETQRQTETQTNTHTHGYVFSLKLNQCKYMKKIMIKLLSTLILYDSAKVIENSSKFSRILKKIGSARIQMSIFKKFA